MANRNRTAGNRFELEIIKELVEVLGCKSCVSSRSESKNLDDAGVDVADPDNYLPFYVQCKKTQNNPDYHRLITNVKKKNKPLVIFHDKQKKQGSRFYSQGQYVSMSKEFFYELMKDLLKK